ncbi:polymorphic toxin-type HINT domain-containing protein [Rossellomorea arthrocnemi]|uniref:polymorphic toxin-type HINT domain-containing protein n=1 Tax=Rossellomorea arthrocnemi TaxID=2769542 RepID=UPI001E311FB2|nr:polymorphic toxin-type HINT domain-containing protein [Rossellomorea arthrocnemi]
MNASKNCNCFTLGTKVKTIDGEKPIEEIQVGDQVLAKDENTGDQDYKEVEWLYEREVDEIYELTIDGEKIETTDEHPFWVDGEGWVKAKDLRTGDQLVTDNNLTLPITNIKIIKKHVTVYNFKVKDYHSYYVSNIGIWTHNSCKWSPKKSGGKKVYQRNYIDWNKKDARGRTNSQRAQKGLAPLGKDGKPINLHHIGQKEKGSIVEVTASIHQKYSKVLHKRKGRSEIDRKSFNKWRKEYWKNRK